MSRKLLDAVFQPEVRLHRADVRLLSASQEEDPPEQQEWSPSLDQEDPAELPHIKEEQEELWTSQEGEQLPGPEEADITKSTFPPVPVKSEEEDEEKPQSSQLHQRHAEDTETETDGEDCGGPEPARSSDPDRHLEPDTDDETSPSSDPETDDSCDWEETREAQSESAASSNHSSISFLFQPSSAKMQRGTPEKQHGGMETFQTSCLTATEGRRLMKWSACRHEAGHTTPSAHVFSVKSTTPVLDQTGVKLCRQSFSLLGLLMAVGEAASPPPAGLEMHTAD
ncbi:uncharacterized protein LOC143315820 isoform X9 [Chaetodon auriga]|uniref:uncharacterized protein LOC143315820 isoform X9 n=1 Tax=Chaetodon auriga TaxID=39042 RepID=UPI00403294E1